MMHKTEKPLGFSVFLMYGGHNSGRAGHKSLQVGHNLNCAGHNVL